MRRMFPSGVYYGWVMVGSAFSINAVAATLNPVVFAFFIGPMSEDLHVSKSALSWALTFRLVAAGVTGPNLGSLIDRFGARWLGAGCAVVAGSMLIAVSFVHTFWLVYLVFAVSGLAGLGGPAGQWRDRRVPRSLEGRNADRGHRRDGRHRATPRRFTRAEARGDRRRPDGAIAVCERQPCPLRLLH